MVSDRGNIDYSVWTRHVLILVLMEYGLWQKWSNHCIWFIRLNPCSNGIWSLTHMQSTWFQPSWSLNPCSNGIWSLTAWHESYYHDPAWVLILVLMEYGLWRKRTGAVAPRQHCLNPCSNGIWSLTAAVVQRSVSVDVLILVLMEYGLWLHTHF